MHNDGGESSNTHVGVQGARQGVKQRRRAMLDFIIQAGTAQVDELASAFGVSRMTVHRDLDTLVKQGLVHKQYGGVTTRSTNVVESNFQFRLRIADREKNELARAAAEFVQPGEAIMLDDSTTATYVARHLIAINPLTVISNGFGVIETLKDTQGIQVIGLGGDYRPRFNAFLGLLCEQSIGHLRANTVLMSVSAIHGTTAYLQDQEVVKVKRALMEAADRRILLVNSQKFGSSALNRLADLSEFDMILTDDQVDRDIIDALQAEGMDVRVVAT
ncbi:DeoR/GlpR family DNA-binding transcription regulator [Aidingimonas halophila]|uniref:Transcriptional regulator, DeoR family n=1 Tax=Aidingimonas halophila TaxID=574349 RepID=A0A1H3FT59_9GAMM|nr:DeoR/GlpR family DNA-binding transcription regulator [Aidingimonas halophila]GHC38439.1 DeoR family transcriptional regulator [Aidingimonas halophila]SDX94025.1 transcriptional regulator, DeoR family [Aidingimonas halophila]